MTSPLSFDDFSMDSWQMDASISRKTMVECQATGPFDTTQACAAETWASCPRFTCCWSFNKTP
jgi:hypothetical protein